MTRFKERNAAVAVRLLTSADPWPSVAWKAAFRRRLLAWFGKHGRTLPWRETADPYAIWVSEIMLQQTQVATVVPSYGRFLSRFPNVTALAAADERDVLRLWEGLGYYRRARQLHAAAKRIAADHGGQFPREADVVRRLPGIGRYTAGAVLSFAFDAREPILEANTLRLFARLLALREEPLSGAGQKSLWNAAAAILPKRGSGALNQALMELGSQVCTPREPRCTECPVASYCIANQEGLQEHLPARTAKPKIEQVREAAVVVWRGGKVFLAQRAAGERWAGLWDFPRFPLSADKEPAVHRELIDSIHGLYGFRIEPRRLLTTLRHSVTRFRIMLECHEAELASEKISRSRAGERWVLPASLSDFPLSMTGRTIAQLVMNHGRRAARR
jgi:A/G-specific adenine glycosylase